MVRATPKPKTAFNARTTFVLGVSIGSPSHEGGSLAAIVDAINGGTFSKGVIDLSDTLKRYKFMTEGMSETEAAKLALTGGDAWLGRNQKYLNRLKVERLDVRRWNEWIEHPGYQETRKLFERIYESSSELRNAIDHDIRRYYARSYDAIGKIEPRAYELSRQFFLEELAAHSLLYTEYQGVNVYPGKQLECFKIVRQGRLPEAPQALISSPYAKMVMHSFDRPVTDFQQPKQLVV